MPAKYSAEWKEATGSWVQSHTSEKWGTIWKIHTIRYGTEYSDGEYLTKKEANEALAVHKAASALGRKGGQAKSERKTMAVRENGKKGGRPRKTKEEGR
jgi:uncharacterized Zn finger protein